jgi:hypothetical protein
MRLSHGVYVATHGAEELSNGSSGVPLYSPTPGWKGSQPLKNGQLHFACFPKFTVSVQAKSSRSTATVTLSSSPGR